MIKSLARACLPPSAISAYRKWQFDRSLPERARREKQSDASGLPETDPGPAATMEASLAWLCRAQDMSHSADGGVARHFSLVSGWAESYPETTGYIIPTMIECGDTLNREDYTDRARQMLDWCVDIQFPDGGFQGGMIRALPKVPTTFNTGQILVGLSAGAQAFGETRYSEAMHKAAAWLRDTQDEDGCWRRFPSPFTERGEKAYETHVSWGLFEAARVAGDSGYAEAGLRQIKWALTKQPENGWFADCCLNDPMRPLTHTIGYVLRGILEAHRFSGEQTFIDAALRTGRAVLTCLGSDGKLPGRFTQDWRPAVNWVCLTGTAQFAYCWLRLFELSGERAFLDGARRANAYVRRTIAITGEADIVGGVKGAFPISGDYGRYEYLNWAAKFSIDANGYEMRIG